MMERLIVKNFGPLKDVDIELNKINLFIGENGSGKSVLAKLVTIFTDKNNWDKKILLNQINEFNISFVTNKTLIKFNINDKNQYISLEAKTVKFSPSFKLLSQRLEQLNLNKKKIDFFFNDITELPKELKEKINDYSRINKALSSQYIPAERNLISLFNRYVTTFITADIPLPKFLLNFSSEYTRAREEIKSLNFLNVEYQLKNGQEHIFYTDEESLLLEHSSSGIQSALPLYLTVKYFAQKHKSIIIEEPEQNLFPKAQSETIKYIVEQISDENSLFMMTHSPYVLSTLNILMMAHKAGNLNEVSKSKVTELYNEKQWINPNDFSAYYLKNGVARDIKGRTGLISENEIDEISDNIQGEFEELLAIYREHKNDK